MHILGIDIGGSGIKGAPVDVTSGTLLAERFRLPTPQPSLPDTVGNLVAEVAKHFDWQDVVGCTFPGIVKNGVIHSAANVDKSWLNTDGQSLLHQKTNCPVTLINDADAAGIAEMKFGAGRDHMGVVIMLTFGTGIGSALFMNGILFPNTELGHLEIQGKEAEKRASDRTRQEKDLSWEKWSERVNEYLERVEFLFSPDLLIVGGGVSKKHEHFLPLLKTRAQIVPAQLLNNAGLVGAALSALSVAGE